MADEWAETKDRVRTILDERTTQELLGLDVDETDLYVRVRQYEVEDGERRHVEDSLYAVHPEPDVPPDAESLGDGTHLHWEYLGSIDS